MIGSAPRLTSLSLSNYDLSYLDTATLECFGDTLRRLRPELELLNLYACSVHVTHYNIIDVVSNTPYTTFVWTLYDALVSSTPRQFIRTRPLRRMTSLAWPVWPLIRKSIEIGARLPLSIVVVALRHRTVDLEHDSGKTQNISTTFRTLPEQHLCRQWHD